jgi:hypothetical protein
LSWVFLTTGRESARVFHDKWGPVRARRVDAGALDARALDAGTLVRFPPPAACRVQ